MAIVNVVNQVTDYVTTQPTVLIGGLARVIYILVVVLKYVAFGMFIYYGITAMRDRDFMRGIKGVGFVVAGLFLAKYGPYIADFIVGNLL